MESLPRTLIGERSRWRYLHCHVALKLLVTGTEYYAHAPVTDFFQYAVARDGLAEPEQRLKGEDVVRVLNRIKISRGVPKMVHCDNGSEFCSQAVDLWAYQHGVRMAFSRPGIPTDNAFVESFKRDVPSGVPECTLVLFIDRGAADRGGLAM